MRILLDECLPRRLCRELPGHDTQTVHESGWSGKKNGELLTLMAARGFEVLMTVDRSLPHQQNLSARGIAVIVLVAASNRLADLRPLMPPTLAVLESIQPGEVVEILS